MPNHRDEALRAIEHVESLLARPELSALEKKMALGALEHAKEHVTALQEVKRPRRQAPKAGA